MCVFRVRVTLFKLPYCSSFLPPPLPARSVHWNSTVVLASPGSWVSLNFTTFTLMSGVGVLYIHEGDSVQGRLIGQYSDSRLQRMTIRGKNGVCKLMCASVVPCAWQRMNAST